MCLQWEFENIIKTSQTDYWLPEEAEIEWLECFNNSKT